MLHCTLLRQIKAGILVASQRVLMWKPIRNMTDVPADRDVRLAVLEKNEVHSLAFPCRRSDHSWIDAKSHRLVEVFPTHWQDWSPD
jgi:hypothetical protein